MQQKGSDEDGYKAAGGDRYRCCVSDGTDSSDRTCKPMLMEDNMKLSDLLQKMSESDFITLVIDFGGVDFEANTQAKDIPDVLAGREIYRVSARDCQLKVMLGRRTENGI